MIPSREAALTFASSCLTYSGSDASQQPPQQPPPPPPLPPGGWSEVPAAARPPSYSPAGAPRPLLPPLEVCRLTSLPGSPEAHMKQLTSSSSTSALSAASPEGRLWHAGASRGDLPGDCRVGRSIAASCLGSTIDNGQKLTDAVGAPAQWRLYVLCLCPPRDEGDKRPLVFFLFVVFLLPVVLVVVNTLRHALTRSSDI